MSDAIPIFGKMKPLNHTLPVFAGTKRIWYSIRFLRQPDNLEAVINGEEIPFEYYYCEGAFAQTLEDAESFDDFSEAKRTAEKLQAAGLKPDESLIHAEPAALLKLQLLGLRKPMPGYSHVEIEFYDDVAIQILKCEEVAGGSSDFSTDVIWADLFQWIWDEEDFSEEIPL